MKKLNRIQEQVIAMAQHSNHKIYKCNDHDIFSQDPKIIRIENKGKCPYCKKKCEEFDAPKITIGIKGESEK